MRIFWLKTELLHPVDKGGKIRTYHMLKHLMRDHEITYLSLDNGDVAARSAAYEYCHQLVTVKHKTAEKFSVGFYLELAANLISRLPYAIAKYRSAAMRCEVQQRASSGQFDVVVCDFLTPSVNVPDKLPCPLILFQHNVEAMIWRRHFEMQTNALKRAYFRKQWQKMRRFERTECRRYDHVVAVSDEDRVRMVDDYGVASASAVTTGVDVDYFTPTPENVRRPHSLVFTGSMDWLPNEDAIRFFIESVMPRVKRCIPEATLTVVGRNPSPSLIALSRADPALLVTGRVEDVRPYMDRASAYIVPIRIGGGTRLKIFEAMAMELPVVSTTIGAEGLPLKHGVELLIADDADEFAAAVIKVLSDDGFAATLGKRAARRVTREFGWKRAADDLASACELALRRGGHKPRHTRVS